MNCDWKLSIQNSLARKIIPADQKWHPKLSICSSYTHQESFGTLWHAACNRQWQNGAVGPEQKTLGEKKMKKTLTAITLAIVLTFGTTFANAGIIVGDKTDPVCSSNEKEGIIIFKEGIIIFVANAITGIIIGDKSAPVPCKQSEGIIVGD
jgi:hypothetical protein